MLKFQEYIFESKNVHMEHLDDLVFNEGVEGTRRAINFLRDLRDMLAGKSKDKISRTVKYDGAPAVFVGIDPRDGKFFVAKKGIFNKDPKVYKSEADVAADTTGDLRDKLTLSFQEFQKLGIKSGVYQGDLMFTHSDLKKETIEGISYVTFQPNTIVYAVPADSALAQKILSARIGVVWHTTYTGNSFETMTASFGENIVTKFNDVKSIWQDDANYKDYSGVATFTEAETKAVTEILSNIGKLFQKVPAGLLNAFKSDNELLGITKIFVNKQIRDGRRILPKNSPKALFDHIHDTYQKKIDEKKTEKSKEDLGKKRDALLQIFKKFSHEEFVALFKLVDMIDVCKIIIIGKMNEVSSLGTFLRTTNGFKVTKPEGYVAIDHIKGAVKLVDRLEFSRANFSSDVIKGWQR